MQSTAETTQDLQPTILVLSLDFDGCTDTEESRNTLIDYIVNYCKYTPEYTEIVVAIGSLRQSIFTDVFNAINNSTYCSGKLLSAKILLTDFVEKLSKAIQENNLSILVTPEKLLASDIFNNFTPGDTFELINAADYYKIYAEISRYDRKISTPVCDYFGNNITGYTLAQMEQWLSDNFDSLDEHEKEKFLQQWGTNLEEFTEYLQQPIDDYNVNFKLKDASGKAITLLQKTDRFALSYGDSFHYDDVEKCLTLYILTQHLYSKYNKPFDVMHFDDRKDLLATIGSYFKKHDYLLPAQSSIKPVEFNTQELEVFPYDKAVGSGDANPNYITDAQSIAKKCAEEKIKSTQHIHVHLKKESVEAQQETVVSSYVNDSMTIFRPKALRPGQKPNPGIKFSFNLG